MKTRTPTYLLLVVLLAACGDAGHPGGSAGEEVPEEERYGGTVIVGLISDLQSMNALTASDNTSNNVQRELLFMPLIKYDEEIDAVPWLAERWDTVRVAPDSIELTFHIRRDVRWHDGSPTTAEDVLFTFERAVNPETAFPNISGFDEYSRRAELLDPYTIRFRLRPHSDYMDMWYQTSIMPQHVLGDVPPAQMIQHPFGTSSPVGNGPFRFLRRAPGQEWVFEANPDFPEALGGRPYLDRVVFRLVPEMTTLLTELLTGRVDVYLGPNPNQAEQIERAPGVRLIASRNRAWTYLAFNTRRPQFSDPRVRRAIAMGLNRQRMVDALVYGYGAVGRSTVTPAHWSYDDTDPQTLIPFDPDGARQLLAEAGWMDRNRDGILEDEQGRQLRFTVITNAGNDVRKDMLEIIEAQLRPLGIVAQPRLLEWNTMTALLQNRERNFDAVVAGWVDYFRKDDRDILHSANLDRPYQYVGYANPRVDQLIDTLAVMTDREQATPLWREYQRLIVQEAPYIPLYYPERLTGVSERIQGVVMDVRNEFTTIARWWVAPRERRG
jgi:peptide/nickel transport system substrate-binding protein